MVDFRRVLSAITEDPRYLANLDWGEPRHGHPEGSVRAHIAELETNLQRLRARLSGDEEYWKLKVLIHTHDSFKAEAKEGVPIEDARSHASLARAFLADYCDDAELLDIVQYHDEPYAIWRQRERKQERLEALCGVISDWNLFQAFLLVDGCTKGKSRAPLYWFFREMEGRVESVWGEWDVWE